MSTDLPASAARLRRALADALPRLQRLPEADAARPCAPGGWTGKQLLGHLIDSASNNHARLVLAPHHDGCLFPDYAQDHWVTAQDYQSEPWEDIVTLWAAFNRHLLHLLERIPAARESHTCVITGINDSQPMTVAFLAERYVKHLEHHLGQILGDPA